MMKLDSIKSILHDGVGLAEFYADFFSLPRPEFIKTIGGVGNYFYFRKWLHKHGLSTHELYAKRYRCNRLLLKDQRLMNYMYGVIAGDGSYSKSKNCIEWTLADKEWITSVHQLFELDSVLTIRKRRYASNYWHQDLCYARILDHKFIRLCKRHGMIACKSNIQSSMIVADNGFFPYFLLGLIDTDGHVKYCPKPKKSIGTIQLCGTKAQLEDVADSISDMRLYSSRVSQRKGDGLSLLFITEMGTLHELISLMLKGTKEYSLKRKRTKLKAMKRFIEANHPHRIFV